MTPSHSGAMLLRGTFQSHDSRLANPKTPEPFADHDDTQQPPSPPRPRFKLKRRVASNLNAPTQQFLASVAAADVPIPSIEQPSGTTRDEPMTEMAHYDLLQPGKFDETSLPRGRRLSPPRTPAPGSAPSLSPRRYPDWTLDSLCSSVESTPECESSRPSTAVSTQTSASLFSQYSIATEDLQDVGQSIEESGSLHKSVFAGEPFSAPIQDDRRRKAKWTLPMTNHLWSTYTLYLRDPKVTPIRFSRSGIPPQGVCCRVAREAKRSWRGANPQPKVAGERPKSGSSTPTAELSTTFMQWPHTGGATRAHLRELCKYMSSSQATRASQYTSHTPTSFGRAAARLRRRRTTPTASAFSSKEMCMSLALSTCESMQPSGPLAQLTQTSPELAGETTAADITTAPDLQEEVSGRRRLASPFTARSYGPSSTAGLGAALAVAPQRLPHTIGAQHALQSPLRLTRSRSNTQQKRRPRQSSAEPRRTKRPSLGSDLWERPPSPPAPTAGHDGQTAPRAQFGSGSLTYQDDPLGPRTNTADPLSGPHYQLDNQRSSQLSEQGPGSSLGHPPRLGSPFALSNTSFSFPNRLIKGDPLGLGFAARPFATFTRHEDVAPPGPSRDLDGRMSHLDQRLRELRQRTPLRKRSESPF